MWPFITIYCKDSCKLILFPLPEEDVCMETMSVMSTEDKTTGNKTGVYRVPCSFTYDEVIHCTSTFYCRFVLLILSIDDDFYFYLSTSYFKVTLLLLRSPPLPE